MQNEKELKKQTDGAVSVPFCTCTDLACPCHPSNHDKGCAPCIASVKPRQGLRAVYSEEFKSERDPVVLFQKSRLKRKTARVLL